MNAELQTKNQELEARSRALEESEARTQAVLKNIKDAIVTLDTEGLIASLSPAFERQTGFKRAAWLGRPFLLLIHPDDSGPTMRRFQNTIHGREESVFEARLNRADGSHVLLEISCTPLLDENEVKGAIGVFRDISDRKRAEMHEAEHKKLKAVLEQLPVGVVIFSKDARVVMHNRQMESILNAPLASSDIRGFTELDLPTFHLDGTPYEPQERPTYRSLHHGETVIGEEMAFYRLDGKQAIISVNTAPIRNERGEVVYVVSVCADVTDSKRSQEELRRRT